MIVADFCTHNKFSKISVQNQEENCAANFHKKKSTFYETRTVHKTFEILFPVLNSTFSISTIWGEYKTTSNKIVEINNKFEGR